MSIKIIDNYKHEHETEWYTVGDEKDILAKFSRDFEKISEKLKEFDKSCIKLSDLEKKIAQLENTIHVLTTDNLRLVNRLLEAEISLERAKNSLVRNHIPFPFAPTPLSDQFFASVKKNATTL